MEKYRATLIDLYPKGYSEFIREGECYWVAFDRTGGLAKYLSEDRWNEYRIRNPKRSKTLITWFRIRITYKRAGVVFYTLEDFKVEESYFLEGSLMEQHLIPCKINMGELTKYWVEVIGYKGVDFSNIVFDNHEGSIEIESI